MWITRSRTLTRKKLKQRKKKERKKKKKEILFNDDGVYVGTLKIGGGKRDHIVDSFFLGAFLKSLAGKLRVFFWLASFFPFKPTTIPTTTWMECEREYGVALTLTKKTLPFPSFNFYNPLFWFLSFFNFLFLIFWMEQEPTHRLKRPSKFSNTLTTIEGNLPKLSSQSHIGSYYPTVFPHVSASLVSTQLR